MKPKDLSFKGLVLIFEALISCHKPSKQHKPRFLDPDRSLNRKRERFKVFEVKSGSNRDDIIINLIIILNIYKNIKLIKKYKN